MLASLLAGGCGSLLGATSPDRPASSSASQSASTTPSPSTTPAASPSTGDAEAGASPDGDARLMPPASACDVVTANDKAELNLTEAKSDDDALQTSCDLSNTPESSPPRHFRNLEISYNVAPPAMKDATAYATTYFEQRRASDFRQPNAFAQPPTVKGTIRQTGDSKAGSEFDEGYYVFYETVVAGAKEGNGLAVIRKGGVVITIQASGNMIPGQRVADSRPIGNRTAQHMIDTVADHVIQGVRPA
jgi:hypothetical protein